MRHGKTFNHLGRKAAHRRATLANMAGQLIVHKRIKTTLAKAKALRVFVEPLLTRSKTDTTHSRRMVFRKLRNKEAVSELFTVVSEKIAERPGGYTRILRAGFRPGDGAELAYIELVDFNETYTTTKKAKAKESRKRSRRGRSRKKSTVSSMAAISSAQSRAEMEELDETKGKKAAQSKQEEE